MTRLLGRLVRWMNARNAAMLKREKEMRYDIEVGDRIWENRIGSDTGWWS